MEYSVIYVFHLTLTSVCVCLCVSVRFDSKCKSLIISPRVTAGLKLMFFESSNSLLGFNLEVVWREKL